MGSVMQLFLGILYIWSIFVAPVSEYFALDVNAVKLTSSFMLCFFAVGVLVGGKLQVKFSTQKVVLAGGLMLAFAMISTALLPQSFGLAVYFTYGIVGGFGVGMGYNAIISTAQRNFPDKRGLATGISVCTFGFSTVIFAPLIESLVPLVGLQNTFFLLGAVFLVATLACFSFVSMPEESGAAAAAAASAGPDFTQSEMLRTKEFYFVAVAMALGIGVYFILNPSFKSIALERGLSDGMATLMIMLTGVSNALGRLTFPLVSDKTSRSFGALLPLLLTAISAFLLIFAQGYLLMFLVVLIAFCYGGYSGAFPLVTGMLFGLKNIGANYGCVMIGFAISALLVPILLSPIESQILLFALLGIMVLLGVFLMLPILRKERKAKEVR